MKPLLPAAAAILLTACATAPAPAPAPEPLAKPEPVIAPQAERDRAQELRASGPTANRGVESVRVLGTVPLAGELQHGAKLVLRARELVVAPGGVVAVHEHHHRPGVAYVLEGDMTEHRGDQAEPIIHRAGSPAFEWTGVIHWWENRGDKPARALVVDIVAEETK